MEARKDREDRSMRVKLTVAMLAASFVLMVVIVHTVVERASRTRVRTGTSSGGGVDAKGALMSLVQHGADPRHLYVKPGSTVKELIEVDHLGSHVDRLKTASPRGTVAGHPSVLDGVTAHLISGEPVDLAKEFAGHVLLIVNVASHCGFTESNYHQLEALYKLLKRDRVAVLAFPCDQFAHQEAGTPSEIQHFVRREKMATFPLFDKINVNGPDAHPLYVKLRASLNVTAVEWNFGKFLVGRDGVPLRYYPHQFPIPEIERQLKTLIGA